MLKIDVIKFEAHDVITTSIAKPENSVELFCKCISGCQPEVTVPYHDDACKCPMKNKRHLKE